MTIGKALILFAVFAVVGWFIALVGTALENINKEEDEKHEKEI